MEFKFLINSNGHIRQRETAELEFKESFHFESIPFYLRSSVGMANNKARTKYEVSSGKKLSAKLLRQGQDCKAVGENFLTQLKK